jgi:hypothetical protein
MSPTKKQQADAAFERTEDKRALALLLRVARRAMHDIEDDDDQYHYHQEIEQAVQRVEVRFDLVNDDAPVAPEPSLPGQMNLLDGSIETCPKCGKADTLGTMIRLSGHTGYWLQCGQCAHVVEVTATEYGRVAARRREQHGHTDTFKSPVIPEKQGRTRGAG